MDQPNQSVDEITYRIELIGEHDPKQIANGHLVAKYRDATRKVYFIVHDDTNILRTRLSSHEVELLRIALEEFGLDVESFTYYHSSRNSFTYRVGFMKHKPFKKPITQPVRTNHHA